MAKKIWLTCILISCCVSITIFSKAIIDCRFYGLGLFVMILFEIMINIFVALYISMLVNELVIKEVYQCKRVVEYKYLHYLSIAANIIFLGLFTFKNFAVINNISVQYVMLLQIGLILLIFILANVKTGNLFMNDNMIYSVKYQDQIEFASIKSCKLSIKPVNIYQIELITANDIYILNLTKKRYENLKLKLENKMV